MARQIPKEQAPATSQSYLKAVLLKGRNAKQAIAKTNEAMGPASTIHQISLVSVTLSSWNGGGNTSHHSDIFIKVNANSNLSSLYSQ